jgi:hypothetical protein
MAECRVSDRLPVTRVGKVAARGWGVAFWGHLRNPSAQLPPRVVTFGALSVAFSKSHKKVAIRISYKFVEGGLHTPNEGDFGVRPPRRRLSKTFGDSSATRTRLRPDVVTKPSLQLEANRSTVLRTDASATKERFKRATIFESKLLRSVRCSPLAQSTAAY